MFSCWSSVALILCIEKSREGGERDGGEEREREGEREGGREREREREREEREVKLMG